MNHQLCISIVNALRDCLSRCSSATGEPVALHAPCFWGNEQKYLNECLDTGWVSSVGKFVDRFERMLADYTGVKRAVATVNGTAALHICLKLAGVKPGDEVLVPTLTFVATVNAISYCGAIPHFVDSEERTLGIDPNKLQNYLSKNAKVENGTCVNCTTRRPIRAVVPVHTFGHPVDLDSLTAVCSQYKLKLIEDAAESLGSYYKGKHTGHWGETAAVSFNGNKIITTGGGGAILTNDEATANLAKHLTTTARLPHQWTYYHDQVGYNYRLPNINAALGCAQIEQLPEFVHKKRILAERYRQAFESISGVRFFVEPEFARSNYWLNVLLLDEPDIQLRDQILEATSRIGIMTRPVWTLNHKLPMYKDCPRMELSIAEAIETRLVNIPSSSFL